VIHTVQGDPALGTDLLEADETHPGGQAGRRLRQRLQRDGEGHHREAVFQGLVLPAVDEVMVLQVEVLVETEAADEFDPLLRHELRHRADERQRRFLTAAGSLLPLTRLLPDALFGSRQWSRRPGEPCVCLTARVCRC
jgi:hypothetical protein